MILLNPRLYINAKLFLTSGIPPAHGGDLHMERTYTWSGLTHGGDIHTEGHIHRGDIHMRTKHAEG